MPTLINWRPVRSLYVAAAAAALLAGASVANAQTVEELIVVGRLGPDSEARSLSQPVSYADLDLTLPGHRDELKRRVSAAAKNLCGRLGETGEYASFAPSCREAAERDSMDQVKFAIAEAPARRAAMVAQAEAEARARDQQALAAEAAAAPASAVVAAPSYTVRTVTNGPVPDTAENRSRYGAPMSSAGASTAPAAD